MKQKHIKVKVDDLLKMQNYAQSAEAHDTFAVLANNDKDRIFHSYKELVDICCLKSIIEFYLETNNIKY